MRAQATRALALICVLTWPALAAHASTTVPGGTLSTDTTWTLAGSPYVVTGQVEIEGTDGPDLVTTLTIEPGVEVRFGSSGWLVIGHGAPGALVADGNAGGSPATITFTSEQVSPAAGDWKGIAFRGSAADSVLRDVVVEYAGRDSKGSGICIPGPCASIHIATRFGGPTGVSFLLEQATIRHTFGDAVVHQGGDLSVLDSTITDTSVTSWRIGAGILGNSPGTMSVSGSNLDLLDGPGVIVNNGPVAINATTFGTTGGHSIEIGGNDTIVGSVSNCPSIESVSYTASDPDVTWTGNNFPNWGERTSRLEPDVAARLLEDNTVTRVGGPVALELTGGTQTLDATWTQDLADVYHLLGSVNVQGTDGPDSVTTLTIDPGMEMRFTSGWLDIGSSAPGRLVADGNADGGPATITFTSDQPVPARGDWVGIELRAQTAAGTLLRNAVIEYAGRAWSSGGWCIPSPCKHYTRALYIDVPGGLPLTVDQVTIRETSGDAIELASGDLTLSDSLLSGTSLSGWGKASGLWVNGAANFGVSGTTLEQTAGYNVHLNNAWLTGTVHGGSVLESVYYDGVKPEVTWDGNTFVNWGQTTSQIDPDDVGSLSRFNSFSPVAGAALEVLGGTVLRDATWASDAGALVLIDNVTVAGTDGGDGVTRLRLYPGVELRLSGGDSLTIGSASGDPGELYADGRTGMTADPVRFTSANDVPAIGDWGGVRVLQTGWASFFETDIRFPATGLFVDGTLAQIEDLRVNRADIGLHLDTADVLFTLTELDVNNTDTAILVADSAAVLRNADLYGTSWGVLNQTPATVVDASYNWWGAVDGPSGEGSGHGCAVSTGVTFAPYQDEPADDDDGIASILDNCPRISNPSQADSNNNGIGDACEREAVLRVSTDAADLPDFAVIQEAVDAPYTCCMTVEVFPGLGPYPEHVFLDRGQAIHIKGVGAGPGDPVIVDGGGGSALEVTSTFAGSMMQFANLTLRGAQGIHSTDVDLSLRDMTYEMIPFEAVDLDGGTHEIWDNTFHDTVGVGIDVAEGASVHVERATMKGLGNAGLVVAGEAVVDCSVISASNGGDGIRLASTGSVDVSYSTIVENTGLGIDNAHAGSVVVSNSIIYDNFGDDLLGVSCDDVSWSDTFMPNCTGVNDNTSLDPQLDPDYRLQAASPCIDSGPHPSTYTGLPAFDADGKARLLDHDGDGLAIADMGAYERANPGLVFGDVQNLLWDLDFRLIWDAEPDAAEYHVYRGDLAALSYSSFGACRDDLDANRTDLLVDDLEEPGLGEGFFYFVSAEDSSSNEGTLGFGTRAERSNFGACP